VCLLVDIVVCQDERLYGSWREMFSSAESGGDGGGTKSGGDGGSTKSGEEEGGAVFNDNIKLYSFEGRDVLTDPKWFVCIIHTQQNKMCLSCNCLKHS